MATNSLDECGTRLVCSQLRREVGGFLPRVNLLGRISRHSNAATTSPSTFLTCVVLVDQPNCVETMYNAPPKVSWMVALDTLSGVKVRITVAGDSEDMMSRNSAAEDMRTLLSRSEVGQEPCNLNCRVPG